jgi:regulator of protease activity HflC (stomatin/prohibitin superfamily)
MIRYIHILPHTRGLLWRDGELIEMLRPGRYVRWNWLFNLRLDRVSTRTAWLRHEDIDVIVKSGLVNDDAVVLDLLDHERALVWIDGRFDRIARPGRHILWRVDHDVRVEVADVHNVQLVHKDLTAILNDEPSMLQVVIVEPGRASVVFHNGALVGVLPQGTYAFWRDAGQIRVKDVDLKEQVLDISGQEIMTADKVTLRMNALVTYRVSDPLKSVTAIDDASQALYRAAQLALREMVGARDLDTLLTSRDALARDLEQSTRARATDLGITVVSAGVRDLILPGDMKELMNRVTEAKKAAEASLITRREETAAMRMQANTAKILESSPTLMRLRELEVLEKVAGKANLTVVVGDGGSLSERVVKLL